MIQLKIHGATPKSGKPLCQTCKSASVVDGQNCEQRIICGSGMFAPVGVVTFKVHACSHYHPINVPWLHEMEQMAWHIEARRRGPVGFEQEGPLEIIVRKPGESDNHGNQPAPINRS